MSRLPPFQATQVSRSALRTTLVYACVAAAWIALSDWVLVTVVPDPALIAELSTYKGWAFVVVTAALLYAMVRRDLGRMERETRARAAMEAERQRWAAAFEHCSHGIALQDPATNRFVACNPAFARLVGFTTEELTGVSIFGKYEAVDIDRIRLQLAVADRTGWASYEATIKRKDGTPFDGQVDVVAVRNGSPEPLYRVVTMQDVTERKKLEMQFMRAQRMEAIGMLAGGVAHDLNNILAPMLMSAGLLKDSVTDPRDRDLLTMVERSAQRGADIVKQLLTFSRGASGVRAPMQARHLLKEVGGILRETFPREIDFKEDAPHDLWPVMADATQLHQVLVNLCINARDAMPGGGTLTVRAENAMLAAGDPRLGPKAQPGDYVEFTVADTGVGMKPETIERIFDPFFTTKGPDKGTGLGLSTVLGIVRSHEGFVTVASEPRCGSKFRVFIPAARGGTAHAEEETHHPFPVGHGELILVVDDEEAIRESFRQVLVQHHYRVVTAGNGREAIARFLEQRESVKLVITDMMMPEMGGAALVRSLRVLQPELRFVATSGLHSASNGDGEEPEVSETLAKPCGPKELLGATARALSTTGAPATVSR
ncbi:MAG TPA: ATP-binding protein [Opitutus sp.]|nr:ATP-binding protein [Opitutus sp.]